MRVMAATGYAKDVSNLFSFHATSIAGDMQVL